MRRIGFAFAALLVAIAGVILVRPTLAAEPGRARVLVGPNILVSRDGDVAHVEIMGAVNPKNPKQLIAGVITATRPAGGWACRVYASADGGNAWVDSAFPEQVDFGGADPQTAFTADGAALFSALSIVKDEQGRQRSALFVYRSEDGGRTWGKAAIAAFGADHPQIVVDATGGKYNGRVYIAYLHGYPEYQISVVRSDDGGRTFAKPVLAASGKGVIGINVTSIHLLSDGTLVVPYADFDFHQAAALPTEATSHLFVVTSADGGDTYSAPAVVGAQRARFSPNVAGFPMFAADMTTGKYRDRMYGVWTDYASSSGRVTFSYSTDKGTTWTKPVVLDDTGAAGGVQYEAQVAVNNKGIVAVTWFDTRTKDLGHYDEYFTASLNGGVSFLTPVRVSSQTSDAFGIGNMQIVPSTWAHEGVQRVTFISAATRWRAAGDYMGLVADTDGVFHPLWADARSGTYQVWTAAVKVAAESEAARVVPSSVQSSDVTRDLEVVTDPARYDPFTHILEMPLRLRNRGGKTIYGPLIATVTVFGSGMGEVWRDFAPEILNATNQKTGAGAEMTYTDALGDFHELAPGALTDAVIWKLKINDVERIPDMHLSIKGSVDRPPS